MAESKRLDRPALPVLVREICPSCVGFVGGECSRCNGSGYVWKDPYAITSGEMAVDESELEEPTA